MAEGVRKGMVAKRAELEAEGGVVVVPPFEPDKRGFYIDRDFGGVI